MKTVIFATFLMVSLFVGLPSTLADQKPPEAPKVAKTASISDLITFNASKYHISTTILHKVIKCESNYNEFAVGDRGTSFGLSQIHLPAHPNITKAQAFDREFAISYMASEISKGNGRIWTCYGLVV